MCIASMPVVFLSTFVCCESYSMRSHASCVNVSASVACCPGFGFFFTVVTCDLQKCLNARLQHRGDKHDMTLQESMLVSLQAWSAAIKAWSITHADAAFATPANTVPRLSSCPYACAAYSSQHQSQHAPPSPHACGSFPVFWLLCRVPWPQQHSIHSPESSRATCKWCAWP